MSGSGVRLHSPGSSVPPIDDVGGTRDDVGRRPAARRPATTRPDRSAGPPTTWPRTGTPTCRSANNRAPRPAQSTTTSAPPLPLGANPSRPEPGHVPPSVGEASDQPVEVDRHLDHRSVERPAVDVPGRQPFARARPGAATAPRRATRVQRPASRKTSVPGSMRTPVDASPARSANTAYDRAAQAVTRSCGSGEIGIPERSRNRRCRLLRQVPAEDVDPVTGLGQPHRTGQTDDARPDDDHPGHESGARLRPPPPAGAVGSRRRGPARARRTPRCR